MNVYIYIQKIKEKEASGREEATGEHDEHQAKGRLVITGCIVVKASWLHYYCMYYILGAF